MRRNPIKLERTLNCYGVLSHRHPDCPFYNKCLNKAVKKRWKSFSCIECSFFKKYLKMRKELNKVVSNYKQKVENYA